MTERQTPHYPSSAELAAFRRHLYHGDIADLHPDTPRNARSFAVAFAWPHELNAESGGIGYQSRDYSLGEPVCSPTAYRREANHLRSAAYRRGHWAVRDTLDTALSDVAAFAPEPTRDYDVHTRPDGTAWIEWHPRRTGGVPWTEGQMAAWQQHRELH